MTDRTEDFHCPRCRKYLFSSYTYRMGREELNKLYAEAATECKCGGITGRNDQRGQSTTNEKEPS